MLAAVRHNPVSRRVRSSVAGFLVMAGMGVLQPVFAAEVDPATLQPLDAVELYALYHDRTWVWSNGAARFYSADRRFLAWTRDDNGESYAEGRFILTHDGRMCMAATWTGPDYTAMSRPCFYHARNGNDIYQRSDKNNDWYLFRSAADPAIGEYAKFTPEDTVTGEVDRIRNSPPGKGGEGKGD